jgi:ELWxxDGT repeat protein
MLMFVASHRSTGTELWRSDGTSAGTTMVQDILPGAASSGLWYLTPFNGMLFFTASDGSSGYELWRSDGTSAGTTLVRDIVPGEGSAFPAFFSPCLTSGGDYLFFVADDGQHGRELWRSDGTSDGTALVRDILPGAVGSSPANLFFSGSRLFFAANDGDGYGLWRSDSTTESTMPIGIGDTASTQARVID